MSETEINGKRYRLVELSSRRYNQLLEALEKQLGPEWSKARSVQIAVVMLSFCLAGEDGAAPPDPEGLWDLPVRTVIRLGSEAMAMNGFTGEQQAELSKN